MANGQNNQLSLSINFVDDIKHIIQSGQKTAYQAVENVGLITYWQIGRRIVEEEQEGNTRATYGTKLIESLSNILSKEYGKTYSSRNLRSYRQFYLVLPDFEIWNTRVPNLTWSHVRLIISNPHPEARNWYIQETSREMWSVRTLKRNIETQYYERLLDSQRRNLCIPKPTIEGNDPREYIKNPMVAEFMGFKRETSFNESELEQALIDNLQQFIMELGRGFAFVDRQKHIITDAGDYFIDLVFYNINLHSYVLIDLKTHQITHQDVGQMDMYVRMFDDLICNKEDNPTIGIVLCSETSRDIARYSVLHDNDRLFATKYMAYMPTEEELRREIEQQKEFFLAKHEDRL